MMKKTEIDKLSDKLVKAFLKNKIIAPLPLKYTKKIKNAQKFRKLCESKVNKQVVGFKAAGTAFAVMKKLKKDKIYLNKDFYIFSLHQQETSHLHQSHCISHQMM